MSASRVFPSVSVHEGTVVELIRMETVDKLTRLNGETVVELLATAAIALPIPFLFPLLSLTL